ncbi:hypothetical protein HRbin12_01597 [bacterium HR12]|nr:hypothetical protein HRbin12_01597 [bacterium HR12]
MLLLQLLAGEAGEATEGHVEDVVRLHLAQLELPHELAARLVGVLRASDDADDLIEVPERDEQPLDDVVPLLRPAELVPRAPRDDVDLVVDVVPHELRQVQRPGNPVHEGEHDRPEVLLELGVAVQLVQDHLGVRAPLRVDDEAHPLLVRLVADVRDVLQPPGVRELRDLLCHPGLVDLVRQLRHDDLRPTLRPLLDVRHGPHPDRTPAGLVHLPDPLRAHDHGARREVRALDEPHELRGRRVGMVQVVRDRVHDLREVMGWDVRGHPHGDPVRPVDEQVGEAAGEHRRLLLVPVEVGHEVHGLGLDVPQHLHGRRRQAGLRVPVGRRRVSVDRTEVPVAVDEGDPHRPILGHAHQGVVHALVAVGVVLLQDVAHDRRGFPVRAVGTEPRFEHGPQDPAVDRLEPVPDVRERPPDDDGHRVVQVRALDLLLQPDLLDPTHEQGLVPAARRAPPRHRGSARPSRSAR